MSDMASFESGQPVAPGSRSVRVRPAIFGVLVLTVFVGTIGTAAALGAWQTTGRMTGSGERVAPQGTSVMEVKGWMAIGDVAAAWDVPLPELLGAFGLPADTPAATPLKDLESADFSVPALREWLAAEADGGAPAAP